MSIYSTNPKNKKKEFELLSKHDECYLYITQTDDEIIFKTNDDNTEVFKLKKTEISEYCKWFYDTLLDDFQVQCYYNPKGEIVSATICDTYRDEIIVDIDDSYTE